MREEEVTKILMVEDHPEYRETIEMVLARADDLELVGQFGSSEMALRSLQGSRGGVLPDVILLDLGLPGMGGLEALGEFMALLPRVKVIILTQSEQEADVLRAISLGASGYLLKSSTAGQIKEGIRTVVAGGASLDPSVAKFIISSLREKLPKGEAQTALSPREMEVLGLIAEGLAKKEIAAQLGIGQSTVVTHVSHVYEKLKVQNAPAAVAKAFGLGILPLSEGEG